MNTTGAHSIYKTYEWAAQKQKVPFDISIDQFKYLASQLCHYCGAVPSNKFKQKYRQDEYIYNGLDKKSPALGYSLQNCVTCCKVCNWAKGKKTYEEFIIYLNNLVNFRKNL